MSRDEFDHAAADDGLETREKGERPRWLHEWLPAHMNDGVRYCSKCGYAEGSLPDCPMSVDRSTPTPPRTVTGQSPKCEDKLTPRDAMALRLALVFGVPDPEPPEITEARRKLALIERGGAS